VLPVFAHVKMFKSLKFIRNQILLNKRRTEEEAQQKREGYRIEFTHEGPESYITYYEGNREIPIGFEFTLLNDVILNANSFRRWNGRGKELTPLEYERVQNRLVRYFSCWGGDVKLDNSPFEWR